MSVSYADIVASWTFTQVLEANVVLDELDRAQAAMERRSRET